MKTALKWTALLLASCLPVAASAHKMFLVPSETVLSNGSDAWITVDAAVSNDLFYFNHHALGLDNLTITGPGGATLKPENANTGKWRSTFDVHLTAPGTWRMAVVSDGMFARYETADGKNKRARGDAQSLQQQIPADAKNITITQSSNRVETFVTLGKPDDAVLKPDGSGLELVPVTHPNDLFAGEPAKFRFVIDGKPAADLDVHVIKGGTRYRNQQNEMSLRTDADGAFSVTWPDAGMYWLNASVEDGATLKPATKSRASYTATLEVLPQ